MAYEGVEAIEALIPHRAPFRLLDRILERGEERIVTEWDVPVNADFFRGHFPGNPILPGVLASELCFQSAAALIGCPEPGGVRAGALPVLTRIQDARFRRVVRPGETLRAEVELTDRLGVAHYLRARVRASDGQTVLKIRFTVALTQPGD